MRQAYARLNLSPLGAAALGTSSFPVNRPRLAELLGFDGLVENSFDANQISPIDMGGDVAGFTTAAALTITALAADITQQYAQTQPWFLLARRRDDRHIEHHAAEAQPVRARVPARAGEHRARSRADVPDGGAQCFGGDERLQAVHQSTAGRSAE